MLALRIIIHLFRAIRSVRWLRVVKCKENVVLSQEKRVDGEGEQEDDEPQDNVVLIPQVDDKEETNHGNESGVPEQSPPIALGQEGVFSR